MSPTKPLPAQISLDKFTVDRIQTYLNTFGAKRPPEVAARLLAYVIELYKRNQPYPPRRELAELLNASPFGLDAAINRALERELITIDIKVQDGNIAKRSSVMQRKYYVPSRELLDAARA